MNPLFLTVLKGAAPYLVAGALGFFAAWWMQGLRVTAVEQDFKEYRLAQDVLATKAEAKATADREASGIEYAKKLEVLRDDSEIFKRCIAAGKCTGLPKQPAMPGLKLQTSVGLNGTGPNTVPAAGEPTTPQVILDCAQTTLMNNALQADIEKQGAK